MVELDFDKAVHSVFAELEKYSVKSVTALVGRGHRELKMLTNAAELVVSEGCEISLIGIF